MPLAAGERIGPYEILAPLGAGGMGEVYRARDTRLGRDVALKVLPAVLASDPERMGSFEREARVLASLNHTNIATLHGLQDSDGVRGLVMELVEGPTLAERIAAGPLPEDEAIRIARQIVDALEYAHDRGIVHRDLKPANIKITPEGSVKVLDFGLAKAIEDSPASPSVQDSPTLTMGATRAGVILGTAAYMSPEQAKGRPADRRADIWSFGVVLYEMLNGKAPFAGETAGEVLSSVIKDAPDLAEVPAAARHLLDRCLHKDQRRRLQSIGEARILLEDGLPAPDALKPAPKSAQRRALPWLVAVLGLGLAAVLAFVHFREPPPVAP